MIPVVSKTNSEPENLSIRAWHLSDNIDIRLCREKIDQPVISATKTDIFYEWMPGKYVFVFNYGVIVFYDMTLSETDKVMNHFFPDIRKAGLLSDEFSIGKGTSEDVSVQFSGVSLKVISQDAIKITMMNLAQSLALLYYDQVSQDLLSSVRRFTSQMEDQGRLQISRKNILRFIGKALNTRNKIAENLYIFDAPPVTWNDEYLDKVHTTLIRHLDLGPRYRSIENTFNIVEANLDTFMELYHQKESSKLEWIIIILIFVEVVDTFLNKIL